MKLFLFTICILCSLSFSAQNKVLNIWGIQMGSTMEQTEKAVLEAEGAKPSSEKSTTTKLVFENCNYMNFKADYVVFEYVDNMLFRTNVIIFPPEDKLTDAFKELKKNLQDTFGKPKYGNASFTQKTKKKDELNAILAGKSMFFNRWLFTNQIKHKQELNLAIDSSAFLVVILKDNDLIKLQKSKGILQYSNDI